MKTIYRLVALLVIICLSVTTAFASNGKSQAKKKKKEKKTEQHHAAAPRRSSGQLNSKRSNRNVVARTSSQRTMATNRSAQSNRRSNVRRPQPNSQQAAHRTNRGRVNQRSNSVTHRVRAARNSSNVAERQTSRRRSTQKPNRQSARRQNIRTRRFSKTTTKRSIRTANSTDAALSPNGKKPKQVLVKTTTNVTTKVTPIVSSSETTEPRVEVKQTRVRTVTEEVKPNWLQRLFGVHASKPVTVETDVEKRIGQMPVGSTNYSHFGYKDNMDCGAGSQLFTPTFHKNVGIDVNNRTTLGVAMPRQKLMALFGIRTLKHRDWQLVRDAGIEVFGPRGKTPIMRFVDEGPRADIVRRYNRELDLTHAAWRLVGEDGPCTYKIHPGYWRGKPFDLPLTIKHQRRIVRKHLKKAKRALFAKNGSNRVR